MAISVSHTYLKKLVSVSHPSTAFISRYPIQIHHSIRFQIMNSTTSSSSSCSAPPTTTIQHHYLVPELNPDEMNNIANQTFQRYSSSSSSSKMMKRNGEGIAIVWFRNDLRVLDNEALYQAWISSQSVLPVYCVDPRLFGTTHYFGFAKTGGISSNFFPLEFRFRASPTWCLIGTFTKKYMPPWGAEFGIKKKKIVHLAPPLFYCLINFSCFLLLCEFVV